LVLNPIEWQSLAVNPGKGKCGLLEMISSVPSFRAYPLDHRPQLVTDPTPSDEALLRL